MKTNSPAAPRLRAPALLLVACCLATALGLAAASAQDNANAVAQGNANNANTTGGQPTGQPTGQPAGQTTGQATGQSTGQTTGQTTTQTPTPAVNPTPALTPRKETPCGGHERKAQPYPLKPGAQLSDLEVVDVYRADTDSPAEIGHAGLYNTICVRVDNLHQWAKAAGGQNDPSKFFLYVNTYPLRGVRARPEGGESDYLRFDLLPTEDSDTHDKETRENWRRVLSRPRLAPPEPRKVSVSIGYEQDATKLAPPIKSSAFLQLVVVNERWFFVFVTSVLVAFGLFLWLVFRSDLLRDDVPEPVGTRKGKPNRKPFSLGRTQMAFWFFLVVTCYVFIWMVTGNGNTITGTVLGLIGISAATALGSVYISASKDGGNDQRRQELSAEKERLWARIHELSQKAGRPLPPDAPPPPPPTSPPTPPLAPGPLSAGEETELRGITRRVRDVDQVLKGASRGFFTDILSDARGVSFHRFQIVAWTVALGAVFLGQVFNYLLMPDFDSTLLALMGISSGTYLGFKFPEKQA